MLGAAAVALLILVIGWLLAPPFIRGRHPAFAIPAYFGLGFLAVAASAFAMFNLLGYPVGAVEGRALTFAILVMSSAVFITTNSHLKSRGAVLIRRLLASPLATARSLMIDFARILRWQNGPILAVFTVFLLLLFYKSLAMPVTAADALTYHAYLPLEAFRAGTAVGPIDSSLSNVPRAEPHAMSDVALWGMLLLGSPDLTVVAILPPLTAGLLILLLLGIGRDIAAQLPRVSGPRAARIAALVAPVLPAALLLSDFSLGAFGGDVWDILPLALLALLAGAAMLECGRRQGDLRWAALASLFAGGAALVKYSGLAFLAVLPLALLICLWPEGWRRRILLALAGLLPGATLISLVLFRNLMVAGNPVFPFATELFGGPGIAVFELLRSTGGPPCLGVGQSIGELAFLLSRFVFVVPLAALVAARPSRQVCGPAIAALLFLSVTIVLFPFGGSSYRYAFVALPLLATCAPWLLALPRSRLPILLALALFGCSLVFSAQTAISDRYDACEPFDLLGRGSWAATPLLWKGPGKFFDDSWFQVAYNSGALALFGLLLTRTFPAKTRSARSLRFSGEQRPRPKRSRQAAAIRSDPYLKACVTIGLILLTAPGLAQAWEVKHRLEHEGHWIHSDREILESYWKDDYLIWQWMNDNLPDRARVYTFETHRLYVEAELADPASMEFLPLLNGPNRPETVSFLKARGITHVLDMEIYRNSYATSELYKHSSVFLNIDSPDYGLLRKEGGNFLFVVR